MSDDAIEKIIMSELNKSSTNLSSMPMQLNFATSLAQQIRQYIDKEIIGPDQDLQTYQRLPGFQKDAWAKNNLRFQQRKKLREPME